MNDPHNLQRFVDAQDPVYEQVLAELRAGRKRSHWMWFVFPQVRGLGRSGMAWDFAVASRAEAEAYLNHPVLGSRLRECCQIVLRVDGRSALQIFGSPDDLKFRSSMTLFADVAPESAVLEALLGKFFEGERCPFTVDFLATSGRQR